ncbi:DUF1592 domain-containing protein [Rubinisphaera italica]|uniref:Cytochrome c domain-containing protein n=1 Tax=Rubinisphaera italica TaxID=2527969 RepID=A0A5C5XQ07_9PLAN|nr:DUF1592 domain-containing protein [Rubinisphaera italica]TWT64155.1 hypothetical protein Pan54_49160 [Rubinisphaera italica]
MWKSALNAKNLRLAIASSLILVLMLNTSATHSAEDFSESFQSLTQKHCVKCHGAEEEIYGEVNLQELSLDDLKTNSELLRSLIDVLDLQEMPPEDEPQLAAQDRQLLVMQFQSMLHKSLASERRYLHTPIRRMNRFQYNNAVVDLFDLKCIVFTLPEKMMRDHKGYFQPETGKMAEVVTVGCRPLGKSQMIEPRLMGVAAFPQDLRAEHGYDNRGDHLSLSPLLMEAFLKLGQSIVESPDFTPKNVGIWREFFAAPKADVDQLVEVRHRLKKFLFKAFRQPVAESQLERYIGYVQHQLESGVPFPEAMKSVAAATIASPNFLYLYDKTDVNETSELLDDFELASRLSFFLWGSLPDEMLLELATNGDLSKPEVLDVQVERMLKDKKIKRFCDSFPSQWLQLERIISSVPDRGKYPDFYFSKYRDSMHMMLEPLLLFETVLIENQPITQFIDSDFTYRSILLEEAYGELATKPVDKKRDEVTTLTFHRVPVTDRRNGGLITNAAVMTMTSGPERTQPITRGAWIAGVIFNNPPEPPPANVPALGEKPAEGEEHLTLRERLSLHRERSDCKGCHEQIDPLGFALENYNPIGVWRDEYENGREIDMQGTLFRQHQFNNVIEFKDAILTEKDRFTRALAGHLLSYALARELGAADQIALDEMTQSVIADEYRFQSLIKQIVFSEPFQSKSGPKAHIALE